MKKELIVLAIIVGIFIITLPNIGFAADEGLVDITLPDPAPSIEKDDIANKIIIKFSEAYQAWVPKILEHAKNLFYYLCLMDLVWMGIQLILKDGNLYDFGLEMVKKILFIGFFFSLLLYGDKWMLTIIDSLRQIGSDATLGSINKEIFPEKIYETIAMMVSHYLYSFNMFELNDWVYLFFCIGFTMLAALIGAHVVGAIVEMYFALTVGIVLLGFGGSGWTSDYALNYLKYIVSVGLKLMAIQMLLAMTETMIIGLMADYKNFKMDDMLGLFLAVFFVYALLKQIPDIITGLLQGTSIGGNSIGVAGAAMVTVASTTAKASGAAASKLYSATKTAATAGLTVRQASQLAKSTNTSAIGAMGRAAASTVLGNIGTPKPYQKPITGGMYANLKEQNIQSKMPGGAQSDASKSGSSSQKRKGSSQGTDTGQGPNHEKSDKTLGSDKGSNFYKSGKE